VWKGDERGREMSVGWRWVGMEMGGNGEEKRKHTAR
jgi:hypothetical protein